MSEVIEISTAKVGYYWTHRRDGNAFDFGHEYRKADAIAEAQRKHPGVPILDLCEVAG